jgi:hypothetical protein
MNLMILLILSNKELFLVVVVVVVVVEHVGLMVLVEVVVEKAVEKTKKIQTRLYQRVMNLLFRFKRYVLYINVKKQKKNTPSLSVSGASLPPKKNVVVIPDNIGFVDLSGITEELVQKIYESFQGCKVSLGSNRFLIANTISQANSM